MAMVELSDDELALVRMLVAWRLSGLTVEISHTDSLEFKNLLRGQRDVLERLAKKLAVTTPA